MKAQSIRVQPLVETDLPFTALQKTLLRINCPVLNNEDVTRYMEKARVRHARKEFSRKHGGGFQLTFIFCAVVAALGLIGVMFFSMPPMRWISGALIVIGAAIAVGNLRDLNSPNISRPGVFARWWETPVRRSSLAGHGMPKEAQSRARAILAANSEAELTIHALGDDPFLSVVDPEDGHRYFIAVWDEAGFIQ